MDFKEKVYRVVKKIPKGSALTYKQVAKKAGRPFAFRAVGNIMSRNVDNKVPCHRVIRSDGKIGGYNGLQGKKRTLLAEEGYLK
jgi:methylated-DNA-[protein]-cysteine S-methyltransferase